MDGSQVVDCVLQAGLSCLHHAAIRPVLGPRQCKEVLLLGVSG